MEGGLVDARHFANASLVLMLPKKLSYGMVSDEVQGGFSLPFNITVRKIRGSPHLVAHRQPESYVGCAWGLISEMSLWAS